MARRSDAEQRKREGNRAWMRAYRATPEGKVATRAAKQKIYATERGREVKRAAHRRWKKSERGSEYERDWARKNYRYEYHIKTTYGLTLEQYEAMASGGCQICGTLKGRGKRSRLVVDHCHKRGTVRGILCDRCNIGIGGFEDNPDRLARAIQYLKERG